MRLLALLLLMLSVQVQASPLEQILRRDSFYTVERMNLAEKKIALKSADFTVHHGFWSSVSEVKTGKNAKEQARNWVRGNSPLGLMNYAINKSYALEFHFGTENESLFLMEKSGVEQVFVLRAFEPYRTVFIVVPEGKDHVGRLILTNIFSESVLALSQSMFKNYVSDKGLVFSPDLVKVVDFHLAGREGYTSSLLKELVFSLPFGVNSVLMTPSADVFSLLMDRKFTAMSILFLKSMYGQEFIRPMLRDIAEKGKPVDMDWNHYGPLQAASPFLASEDTIKLFKEFEKELFQKLTAVKNPVKELFFVGNEIATDKDLVRKSEILHGLQIARLAMNHGVLSAHILPYNDGSKNQRMLVIQGASGQYSGALMKVLFNLGIENFYFLGMGVSLKDSVEGMVFPQSVFMNADETVKLPEDNAFAVKGKSVKILHRITPLLDAETGAKYYGNKYDCMDESSGYFAKGLFKIPARRWGMGILATHQNSTDAKNPLMARSVELQQMTDFILNNFKIKDLLPLHREMDFGFSSLEEKLHYFDTQLRVDLKKTVIYHAMLLDYLKRNLKTEAELKAWLGTKQLRVFPVKEKDVFDRYLERPFEDSQVMMHLYKVEQALEEFCKFLSLYGEKNAKIKLLGEFATGTMAPGSPLLISLSGVSQDTYSEIMSSPFGSRSSGKPFVLQVIPGENRLDSTEEMSPEDITKGKVFQMYAENLKARGIYYEKSKGFTIKVNEQRWHFRTIARAIHRWQQGCEMYKRLVRFGVLKGMSPAFSWNGSPEYAKVIPANKQVFMDSVNRLKLEGLDLMKSITDVKVAADEFPRESRKELLAFIEKNIALLDIFTESYMQLIKTAK